MVFFDVECYKNYFLVAFMDAEGRKVTEELHEDGSLDPSKIERIMKSHTTVGFNSNNYDLIIIMAALKGYGTRRLKAVSDEIIAKNTPGWKVAKSHGLYKPKDWDTIDLIDVAPGQASLKIYGGRLGSKKLQDLPIHHEAELTGEQKATIKKYCWNDVQTTRQLYEAIKPQIELREKMSEQYGMDLRSKSDAQIAEKVLSSEIEAISNKKLYRDEPDSDTTYSYTVPEYIQFEREDLQDLVKNIAAHSFELAANGSVALPDWLKKTKIVMGDSAYQMGIGGLHSSEKSQSVVATSNEFLADFDVASFYPSIILNLDLAPANSKGYFNKVYREIVETRLAAKKNKDSITSDMLKVTINSSFGKLGSKWSTLYAPQLLIQVTLTGQLSLLMLIERLEAAGIKVVSANTDGIVVYGHKDLEGILEEVTFGWQIDTGFVLERADYSALYSRDVNNYVAVKPNGHTKSKGAFAKPWLTKNPQFPVVYNAVAEHLAGRSNYKDAILSSNNLLDFCMLRKVTGGATWDGDFLGRVVRFYYSTEIDTDVAIRYSTNGNKVPQSDGSRPCLDLPDSFPNDVDFDRYVAMAEDVFGQIGYDA